MATDAYSGCFGKHRGPGPAPLTYSVVHKQEACGAQGFYDVCSGVVLSSCAPSRPCQPGLFMNGSSYGVIPDVWVGLGADKV